MPISNCGQTGTGGNCRNRMTFQLRLLSLIRALLRGTAFDRHGANMAAGDEDYGLCGGTRQYGGISDPDQ